MAREKKYPEIHRQLNLQNCIKALLLDADSRKLTKSFLEGEYEISEDWLVRLLRHECRSLTLDQLKAVARMFSTQWMKSGATHACVRYAELPSIFNMLLHFVDNGMLYMESSDCPVCQWEGILRWNDLTNKIGEDVMVCAYLAGHDLITTVTPQRKNFNWPPYIKTDDPTLNMILEMPLADIHAHLKGSSLNFEINWICLMNHIEGRKNVFTVMSKQIQSAHTDEIQDGGYLYKKALLAAVIRLYLLDVVYRQGLQMDKTLDEVMRCKEVDKVIKQSSAIQVIIEDVKKNLGAKYTSTNGDWAIFDYAIIQGVSADVMDSLTLLSGERFLLYSILRKIYSNVCTDSRLQFLFLLYLVIKNEIRHEITQLNETVGFDNFNIYENRKLIFVDDDKYKHYKNAALHLSIKDFFGNYNPKNRYYEVRIVPKDSEKEINDDIKALDEAIEGDLLKKDNVDWSYRYIFHFIKKKDSGPTANCRHYELRSSVKTKALAIYAYRNGLSVDRKGVYVADRVVGVDAANSEIACRPEVFAQAFRFLRHHKIEHPELHRPIDLGVTYHVGEDFMDVVDGLRAVDEAILFLPLRKGDRIGHGLVLGVDVNEYYRTRNYTVSMSLQMMMDNMAWLYHYVRELKEYSSTLTEIKDIFYDCYHRVHEDRIVPSIGTYYDSMLLRGDDPECYMEDGTIRNHGADLQGWQSKALNAEEQCNRVRSIREVRKLYHQYHYEEKGKERGNDYMEWMVSCDMIDAINEVQRQVLEKVEKLGLAIECNPTSNIKIGEIVRYDEHPILRFNNEGLGYKKTRSLSVSINTDDKGVFATSIEREYALMAHAIIRYFRHNHKEINDSDVYSWLDRIRRYSLLQRFDKSDSHFDEPSKETIENYRNHILEEVKQKDDKKKSYFARILDWLVSVLFKKMMSNYSFFGIILYICNQIIIELS